VIKRLRDALVPLRTIPREQRGYRRLLGWAALSVTDRRWAAPLLAVALGFGLFAGVAIGPGAAGSLATAPYQLLELPVAGGGGEEVEGEEEDLAPVGGGEEGGGFGEEEAEAFAPVAPLEAPLEAAPEDAPPAKAPKGAGKEEEPAEPEGAELAGIVVHVNEPAGSYTVAEAGGVMSAVHAGKLPAAGSEVEVPIETVANGTLKEAGERERTARKPAATLAGIVTFVGADPVAPAYALSNRGTSALIHVQPDPSGALPELPALGAYATVEATIEGDALRQRQLSSGGAPFTHAELEGIVASFDPASGQLLISADDLRESGQDIALVVPAGIDAASLTPGVSVLVSVDIGTDGSLTLTGLASDEHLKGADDADAIQGDLVPEKGKEKG
jgi:hypothetical protein